MYKLRCWLLLIAISLVTLPALAAEQEVSVSLFSKYHPHKIVLEPESGYLVNGVPENGPLRVVVKKGRLQVGAVSGSSFLVEQEAPWANGVINGKTPVYLPRKFRLQVYENEVAVTALVPIEEYVAAVVQAEMSQGPPAALAAQAILVRTYLAANTARHTLRGAQLCDLTHCQVYRAGPIAAWALTAAQSTRGVILVNSGGEPANAFYSSTCGGQTVAPSVIWPGEDPELVGVADKLGEKSLPLCVLSPHRFWFASINKETLRPLLRELAGQEIAGPYRLTVENSEQGVVTRLRLTAENGSIVIPEQRFHQLVGRKLGWQKLKSSTYEVANDPDILFFAGQGLGHQVGLCQYGARALALKGFTAKKILRHYFPRLELYRYWE